MKKQGLFRHLSLVITMLIFSCGINAASLSDLTYNEAGGYYEITSAEDMVAMSKLSWEELEGKSFVVVASELDFSNVSGYTPFSFGGTFDGRGVVVKNLIGVSSLFYGFGGSAENIIFDSSCSFTEAAVAVQNSKGTIRNCVNYANVTGGNGIGGIVGQNFGLLENCANYGAIIGDSKSNWPDPPSGYIMWRPDGGDDVGGIAGVNEPGGRIIRCENHGVISGPTFVGGIAGYWRYSHNGEVRECINTGRIDATNSVAGGIVGGNDGSYGRDDCPIIDCMNSGLVTAKIHTAGGIIGFHSGIISNCHNSNDVKVLEGPSNNIANQCGGIVGLNWAGTISDCTVMAEGISGYGDYVGGIAGFANNTSICGCNVMGTWVNGDAAIGGILGSVGGSQKVIVQDCIVHARITGKGYIGGIVGNSVRDNSVAFYNGIINCEFMGSVKSGQQCGGIVGLCEGTEVRDCRSSGVIDGGDTGYAGGIAGQIFNSTMSGCVVTGDTISGCHYVGALIGLWHPSSSEYITPLSENYYTKNTVVIHNGMVYDDLSLRGVGDFIKRQPFDLTTDTVNNVVFYNCAVLKADYVPATAPTLGGLAQVKDSVYAIGSAADMVQLSAFVNAGNTCEGLTFQVTVPELDFSGMDGFSPIGHEGCRFAGVFDGQGVRISNLKIEEDNLTTCVGLFGYVTGTVCNVHLGSSCVISGGSFVGGIVGKCWGIIEGCTIGDNSTLTRNGAGDVCLIAGKSEVGGIAGGLYYGQIRDCRVAEGKVSGDSYVGSVLGYNYNGALSENYYEQSTTVMVGETVYDSAKPRGLGAEANKEPTDVAESVVDGVTYQNGIVLQSGFVDHIQSAVSSSVCDDVWYDLSGRRVTGRHLSKGVYIHQGRKVMVK